MKRKQHPRGHTRFTLSVELPEKLSRRAKVFGVMLILICIIFTIYLTNVFLQMNRRTVTTEMEDTVGQVVDTFRKRIEGYTDALYAGRAIFLVNPNVTQTNWQEYVSSQSITDRYPGLSSILYVSNESNAAKSPIVALTAPESAQYLANLNITNPVAKQALMTASTTGQPVSSTPFQQQVKNDGKERVSMILAIYRSSYTPTMTDQEKIAATRGYIVTTLEPQSIFSEAIQDVSWTMPVNLSVKDQDGRVFYDHSVVYMSDISQATGQKTLDVGGRTWEISYAVPSDYKLTFVEKHTPTIVIIGGTIFMTLLTVLYFYRKGLALNVHRSERFAITRRRQPRE